MRKRAFAIDKVLTSSASLEHIENRDGVEISLFDWLEGADKALELIQKARVENLENARVDQLERERLVAEHGASFLDDEPIPKAWHKFTFKTELLGTYLPMLYFETYDYSIPFGSRKSIDGERLFEGPGYSFVHYCMVHILEFEGITFEMIDNARRETKRFYAGLSSRND